MARGIDLSKEVSKILKEYGDEVTKDLQFIVPAVGKDAAAKLRKESPRNKNPKAKNAGRYKRGWTSTSTLTHTGATATVYGRSGTYQLAHLLENGHAKRGGGRVPPAVHIKPVEEWAESELERLVTMELSR